MTETRRLRTELVATRLDFKESWAALRARLRRRRGALDTRGGAQPQHRRKARLAMVLGAALGLGLVVRRMLARRRPLELR
jgi:hypothetical protein